MAKNVEEAAYHKSDTDTRPNDKFCPDCGAKPGEIHADGCDVERCPECGRQRLCCDHEGSARIPWSGLWPGKEECREYGFWCRWGPPWLPCDSNHPEATEDLNRLHAECAWDTGAKRWVLKPGVTTEAREK